MPVLRHYSNVVALPQHLVALLVIVLLKIVTFNTVLMVLKILTLLYNGHLCFGDRFEVINTTLVLCIPVILSIDHVSALSGHCPTCVRFRFLAEISLLHHDMSGSSGGWSYLGLDLYIL